MASTASIAAMSTPPIGGAEQAGPDAGGHRADQRGAERAHQELALDGHVDHAGAFAEHPGQRAEDQRQRPAPGVPLGGVDQRQELARPPASTGTTARSRRCPARAARSASAGPARPAARAPAASGDDAEQDRAELPVDRQRGALGVLAEREPGGLRLGASAPNSTVASSADHEQTPTPRRRCRSQNRAGAVASVSSSTVAVDIAVTSPSPSRRRAARRGRRGAGRSPSPGPARR